MSSPDAYDDRVVFVEARELAVDVLAALRERVDLGEQLEQARVQQHGHRAARTGERVAHGLDRALRADRDADSELAQAAAQEVDAGGSSGHPLRAQAMQLLHGLL